MGCVVGGVVTLDCLPGIIGSLLFWLLTFAGSAALLFVIIGGFKFLTSGGDKEKVEGARKTLTWAIVGLIVILSSFMIVRLAGQVTGITCISAPFNPGGVFSFGNCGLKKSTCTNSNVPVCADDSQPVCLNTSWSCGTAGLKCLGNPNCPKDEDPFCDSNTGTWSCQHSTH